MGIGKDKYWLLAKKQVCNCFCPHIVSTRASDRADGVLEVSEKATPAQPCPYQASWLLAPWYSPSQHSLGLQEWLAEGQSKNSSQLIPSPMRPRFSRWCRSMLLSRKTQKTKHFKAVEYDEDAKTSRPRSYQQSRLESVVPRKTTPWRTSLHAEHAWRRTQYASPFKRRATVHFLGQALLISQTGLLYRFRDVTAPWIRRHKCT